MRISDILVGTVLTAAVITLIGCGTTRPPPRAAAAEPPRIVSETASLWDDSVRLTAEFGHRSYLAWEASLEETKNRDERVESLSDRRPRYRPGSGQENFLRLRIENVSAEEVEMDITTVVTTMGRFRPQPASLRLEPGQSGRLNPFFFTYPRHYGDFMVEVVLSGVHGEQTVAFQLTDLP